MTIANELIALVEQAFAGRPAPRIRALHLPPASAAGSKNGEFCALELDDGALGLSYVLLDDTLAKLGSAECDGTLAGADALTVARWYGSETDVRRTLGFAAINALTRAFFDRAGYAPPASADSTGLLEPQPGDHIGMIGFFTPLIGRIVAAGARLTVAELNPDFAGEHDGYRVTLDPEDLATCNKVLSTSTLLLNDSLERMLGACRSAGSFAMIGPSAGCLPDPLFARGVTLLGGSWIEDSSAFIDSLRSGDSWGRHTRKFAIRREAYPGFAPLLAGGR
jgi:uncharacterized protein (DUF4213/DUF364 family)